MLPLWDSSRRRGTPILVYAIIAANLVVQVYASSIGAAHEGFYRSWGLVPASLFSVEQWSRLGAGTALPLLTHIFVHAGWLHFLANMWFLWIFGDNVEDWLGQGAFLATYTVGGVAAGLGNSLLVARTHVPMVGASGAVAAVLGVYLVAFPTARVRALVPLCFLPLIFELPAYVFFAMWFLFQVFSGIQSGMLGQVAGVAWWAHVVGFLFGVAVGRRKARRPRRVYDWEDFFGPRW